MRRKRRLSAMLIATGMLFATCSPAPSISPIPSNPSSSLGVSQSPVVTHAPGPSPIAGSGSWTATGPLTSPRGNHTATLLKDGRVLVAGGQADRHGAPLASAELYDPTTRSWGPAGVMTTARYAHTATLLPNGMVLVAGGLSASNDYLKSAELFDPRTGTWRSTAPMHSSHAAHTATLLNNGKVLVAGGSLGPAELYDPKRGTWTVTGALPRILDTATATLLDDGDVVLTGGAGYDPDRQLASTELYDPRTGSWSEGKDLNAKRVFHAATLLIDGKVLITGGFDPDVGSLRSAELSDPSDGSWISLDPMHDARLGHTATLLPNGLVLVAGGQLGPGKPSLATAELYDSSKYPGPSWIVAASMTTPRDGHTATLLQDGGVLVAGGLGTATSDGTAETYHPDPRPLPKDGRADQGRYAMGLEPAMSMTLTLRGSVDVATTSWIDIEFGFDPLVAHGGGTWGAEIQINRPEQVLDPTKHVMVAMPPDLADWIGKHPDAQASSPVKTTIGGREAVWMDVVAGPNGLTLGPIDGFPDIDLGLGAGGKQRWIIVKVGADQVVIRIGTDNDPDHFARMLDAFQPMLDSVSWD